MRIKCRVEYIGTKYQGWQKQPNGDTIQSIIEEVLSKILNETIIIHGSGRTDTGVHAKGQYFHFDTSKNIADLQSLKHSMNCLLPEDIKILEIAETKLDFHSRLSAKKKIYRYDIYLGECDVFSKPFCYEINKPFSLEKFKKALSLFLGEHDFKNFTSKETDEAKFIRNIEKIDIEINGNSVSVLFVGNGFMRYMIRDIVGTCVACATEQISISSIDKLLKDTKRNIVSYKAPAQGLFLVDVLY